MRYLIVDGMLGGTGIRNKHEGGYIEPKNLLLSDELLSELKNWKDEYEQAKFAGFNDEEIVLTLDARGVEIAKAIKKEMMEIKIEYFSDALMKRELID